VKSVALFVEGSGLLGQAAQPAGAVSAAGENPTHPWLRIIDAHFDGGGIVVILGPVFFLAFILVVVLVLVWKFWLRTKLFPEFEVVEAELELANVGKITIKPNHENVQIAHAAWVEICTRKAALPFVEDHDVVLEVYESYYQLFAKLRELTKNIPAYKLRRCRDTRELVNIMVKVLNYGLRPHLTRWQARFRKWYNEALSDPANRSKSPQDIQRGFPDFPLLIADLKALQTDIVTYSEFLRQIAQGNLT